jgi:U32 family peptidase
MVKEKELGKVVHWYDKIGVAVVDLKSSLKKGDAVKVKRGENEFEDTITSIQIEHKDVDSAKKGDSAAIKLSSQAKEGSTIHSA